MRTRVAASIPAMALYEAWCSKQGMLGVIEAKAHVDPHH
jgi:hypothetical protein